MKTKLIITIVLIFSILIPPITILADYVSTITVSNNSSTTSYNMFAGSALTDINYMATNGIFDNTSGLDTRIHSGTTERKHMLSTDRITFATPIGTNSNVTLRLTTGNSNIDSFAIIPGHADNSTVGYVEAPTEAYFGNNSTLTIPGYLNTENGTSKFIANKPNSVSLYVSGNTSGTVLATIGEQQGAQLIDGFDTDNWNDVGDKIFIDTGNSRLDYDALRGDGDDRTWIRLSENASDIFWRLNYTWNPTSDPVENGNVFAFGLFDNDSNYDGYAGDYLIALQYSSDSIAIRYSDGGASATDTGISIVHGTTYYVTLERTSDILATLSIYSDSGRTTHIAGSPETFAIPATVVNLDTLQGSNFAGAGLNGREIGWIDDLNFGSALVTLEATGITSGNTTIKLSKVETGFTNLYPTGNGSVSNLQTVFGATNHWEAVDEVSADDATTYLQNAASDTAEYYSYFTCPDIPYVGGNITSVTVYWRARQNIGNFWRGRVRLIQGASIANGATHAGVSVPWTTRNATFSTAPDGSAWNYTDFDNLQIGVGVWKNNGADVGAQVTQVYMSINASQDFALEIGGVLQDSDNTTVTIPEVSGNWSFLANNSMSYADSILITENNTQKLYYNPNTILVSSNNNTAVIPDRANNFDGVVYFGSNPSNITSPLGIFESDYTPVSATEDEVLDIAPTIPGKENATEAARRTALEGFMFFELFEAIETVTLGRLTVVFQFQMMLFTLALVLFAIGYWVIPGENLIIAGVLSDIPIGIGIVMTQFDWWVIAAAVLWLAGCVVTESRRVFG